MQLDVELIVKQISWVFSPKTAKGRVWLDRNFSAGLLTVDRTRGANVVRAMLADGLKVTMADNTKRNA
jgi:hypothetical protein